MVPKGVASKGVVTKSGFKKTQMTSKKRSKMTKFGVKMTKIGSNLGFGVKVRDFWGKRDGRHTKNEPQAIFGV